jgi:hypothetical protein
MAGQVAQVPKGAADFVNNFSPVDMEQAYRSFRYGEERPGFRIPPALTGLLQMMGHGLTGNATGLMHDVQPIVKPYATLGRGVHALADQSAPAPSDQEWQQATRGATSNAAALLAPEVPGRIATGVRTAATAAGIPQLMSEVAGSKLFGLSGAGPIVRAAARRLYEPPMPPKTGAPPINAEFVDQPPPTIDAEVHGQNDPYRRALPTTIDRSGGSPAAPPPEPPPPPGQLGGRSANQPKLPPAPKGPKGLPAGPVSLPEGTDVVEPESDPRLPQTYASTKVGKPSPPAVMGNANFGEEGGVGPQPHQDVTAQRPMLVRTVKGDGSGYQPGQMRPETVNEMKARLTNLGRMTTRQPAYDAEPYRPPKPTPPPKGKK